MKIDDEPLSGGSRQGHSPIRTRGRTNGGGKGEANSSRSYQTRNLAGAVSPITLTISVTESSVFLIYNNVLKIDSTSLFSFLKQFKSNLSVFFFF